MKKNKPASLRLADRSINQVAESTAKSCIGLKLTTHYRLNKPAVVVYGLLLLHNGYKPVLRGRLSAELGSKEKRRARGRHYTRVRVGRKQIDLDEQINQEDRGLKEPSKPLEDSVAQRERNQEVYSAYIKPFQDRSARSSYIAHLVLISARQRAVVVTQNSNMDAQFTTG